MTAHALGCSSSWVKFSHTAVVVLNNSIRNQRNSRRNGKMDLLCISVWDGTGCITVSR